MFKNIKQVTVCGGGNAAHVVIPLIKHYGAKVTLYTPFENEAALFKAGAAQGNIELFFAGGRKIFGGADLITTDAALAARSDLVLMVLPAFAHGPTLQALAPHLSQGVPVGALPARSGFELQANYYLPRQKGAANYFCGQTLPWACRIEEYGLRVKVLGLKESVPVACVPAALTGELAGWLSAALQANFVPVQNVFNISLGNIGQVIHPGIMYGLLKDYRGTLWQEDEIPLFYQGVTPQIASVLEALSAEIEVLCHRLTTRYNLALTQVKSLYRWLTEAYSKSIEDKSTLFKAFNTNRSYQGLKIPVKKTSSGYIPDFKSRYLTEDVPFGLLYTRALADKLELATPVMDKVILWAEKMTGKKYFGAGLSLQGPDLFEARIPQNYGIFSIEQLLALNR